MGATEDELACGVDMEDEAVVEEGAGLLGKFGKNAGNKDIAYIAADDLEHLVLGYPTSLGGIFERLDELVVLSRYDESIDMKRGAIVIIFDSHLAFGIGTKICDEFAFTIICHLLSFATDVGEFLDKHMGKVERERHQGLGFVDGVAEHHALVASTLMLSHLAVDTLSNVSALLMNGREYAAAVAVEAVGTAVVANAADDVADDSVKIDICVGRDLTGNYDLAGGD